MPKSSIHALTGRLGAYVQHARHDPRETTAAARVAFLARFEREVDERGLLDPAERRRRAESARKAYFTRLALASASARSHREPRRFEAAPTPRDAAIDQ